MAELYHVLNRGVEKRKIFSDDKDYFRFVHDLFEFNDKERVNNVFYRFQNNDLRGHYIKQTQERRKREFLVKIHGFCLMPNHFHLLLSQQMEGGIPKFLNKLSAGYSKYFNTKYERVGPLFQGRYKRVLIKNQRQLLYILFYIHLNPLDLFRPEWRDRELKDHREAIRFLENYRWSSHLDYCGKKNFPSVTQRDFFIEFFGGPIDYKKSLYGWLKDLELESISPFALEDVLI